MPGDATLGPPHLDDIGVRYQILAYADRNCFYPQRPKVVASTTFPPTSSTSLLVRLNINSFPILHSHNHQHCHHIPPFTRVANMTNQEIKDELGRSRNREIWGGINCQDVNRTPTGIFSLFWNQWNSRLDDFPCSIYLTAQTPKFSASKNIFGSHRKVAAKENVKSRSNSPNKDRYANICCPKYPAEWKGRIVFL